MKHKNCIYSLTPDHGGKTYNKPLDTIGECVVLDDHCTMLLHIERQVYTPHAVQSKKSSSAQRRLLDCGVFVNVQDFESLPAETEKTKKDIQHPVQYSRLE